MNDALQAEVDRLVDAAYLASSAAAVELVRAHAAEILDRLGWRGGPPWTPIQAASELGVEPSLLGPLSWLLEEAADAGWLRRIPPEDGGLARFERAGSFAGEIVRQVVERAARDEAALGFTPEMAAYVAGRYPDFLRGERSGAAILLKPPGLELWERYFSAENPLYDLHNRIAVVGLARSLESADRPLEVLELGAGTGGATAAVLRGMPEVLRHRLGRLTISDVAPSFLVRIAERLADTGSEVRRKRLDFDCDLGDQGFAPGSVDVVIAVNALHNARDLRRTLDGVAGVLSPEGTLMISESLCEEGRRVHQEMIFNLLPGLRGSAESGRLRSRFFSSAEWKAALETSPFEASLYRNRAGPELALLAVARPAS